MTVYPWPKCAKNGLPRSIPASKIMAKEITSILGEQEIQLLKASAAFPPEMDKVLRLGRTRVIGADQTFRGNGMRCITLENLVIHGPTCGALTVEL